MKRAIRPTPYEIVRQWTSRRTRGAVGATLLLAVGLTLSGVAATPASAAVSGTVTGTVFRDFNGNGTFDTAVNATSATDVGVGGAAVRAFDDTGALVGTATSANDGTYSLAYAGTGTSPQVRVQLTMPAGYHSTAHGTAGAVQGGTTVQFETNGGSANFGIARVGDYSQDSPDLVVPVQHGLVAGGKNGPAALAPSSSPTLVTVAYGTTGVPTIGTGAANQRVQANLGQTGTVWGVAPYGTGFAFSATLFKRFAPVGPQGLGAIYLTSITPAGATANPNAALFVQIPNAGTNPRTGLATASGDAGQAGYDWFHDAAAFPAVHMIGLGGLHISPDGKILYVVNLNNRTLYAVPVIASATAGGAPTAGTPTAIALPTALPSAATGCADASVRPFGLNVDDRSVWVALTCTGPADSDVRAYVYRYDRATAAFDGAPAFEASLTGARGAAYTGGTNPAAWHAWTNTFKNNSTSTSLQSYPQPTVSDLAFDSNGDLSIAIKDRNGDQNGEDAGGTDTTSNNAYESFNAGDVLRACLNAGGTAFVLENAGVCGSRTGSSTNNNQGPGGGEFYSDEFGGSHNQTSLGGVHQVPGFAQLVATSFDPDTAVRVGGFTKKSNSNGAKASATQLTNDARGTDGNTDPTRAGTFGKADGIGDIEALVAPAPIEIGNRVWNDTNLNGIQDPGEKPIVGVTVDLYTGTTLVATKVTDSNGEYYFGTVDGLRPNTAYRIALDLAADYTTGPLASKVLTKANAGTDDAIDSDATIVGGFPQISYTTGAPGADDHTLDFGFNTQIDLTLSKSRLGSGPFIPGDTVKFLLTPHNNGPGNAIAGWSVTDVLPPGLTLTSMTGTGYSCTLAVCTATAGLASGADGAPITVTATINAGFTGIAHNVAYISPAPGEATETNPLVVPTTATNTSTTATNNDAQADVTSQSPVSIGDRAFIDTNRNGIQDTGEPSLPGVTVTLKNAGGTTVGTATTDQNGFYSFTGLRPGAGYSVTFSAPGYTATTQTATGSTNANDSNPDVATGVATFAAPSTGSNSATTPDDPTIDAGFVSIDLALSKSLTSTGVVVAGDTVTFSLVPHNNGPADALAGWKVTELAPAGLTITSMAGTGYACTGNVCTAAVALGNGADGAAITVSATVDASFTGVAHNVAYVSPAAGDVPETNPLVVPTTTTDTSTTFTNNDAQANLTSSGLVSIGDHTFLDTNRNGIQDAGEPAQSGVTVTLKNSGGTTVGTATTDSNGFYSFTDLRPQAAYTVTFAKAGVTLTTQTAKGSTTVNDSNPDAATGVASFTAPATGVNSATTPDDPTIDAGFVSIDLALSKSLTSTGVVVAGDTVTFSLVPHNNGPADALAGWKVTEVAPAGLTITSMAGTGYTCNLSVCTAAGTLANGADGSPITVTASVDAGFTGAAHNVAYISPAPVDVPETNPLVVPTTATDTQMTPTNNDAQADLTSSGLVSIGDHTFLDTNRNGIQDGGEPALSGVTVTLKDSQGSTIGVATTDSNGFYSFTDLRPQAAYTVTFAKAGVTLTTQTAKGSTTVNDSNPAVATGIAPFTAPSTGVNSATTPDDPTIDAGFVSIDLALSKALTSTGVVVAGDTVTFSLLPHNNGPADALAGWKVTEVAPAGLTISSMAGTGYSCTGNVCTAAAALADGADGSPITVTATVDASFTGVAHNVAYISPAPGDVPETNLLVVPTTNTDTQLTPTNNDAQANLTSSGLVSIGDHTFLDTNRNGIQDAGEPALSGVTVTLKNSGGAVVGTATTDSNGFYSFTDLRPQAAYTVTFAKAGVTLTTQTAPGSTTANDSNPSAAGIAPFTAPATGSNSATTPDDPTIDAGFVSIDLSITKTLTSTGLVYQGDTVTYSLVPHNNGPADALAGWSVTEVAPAGLTITSMAGTGYTCTDATCTASASLANGADGAAITVTATVHAEFSGIAHNVAYISPAPGEVTETNPLVVPTTATDTQTTPTNNDDQVDLSVAPPVSIGDHTFIDTNRNGIQDAGEPALPGVTVTLADSSGHDVATTTTDANGFYSFTDLRPGTDYTVTFSAPGYTATTQKATGSTTADDSNPGADGRAPFHTPVTGANSVTSPDDPTIDAGFVSIDLSITKTLVTTGAIRTGDTVTFTLVPHNNGPADALPGWKVTDLAPAGLTLTSVTGDPGSYICTATGCTSLVDLASGSDGPTIIVTAKVQPGFTGGRNLAYITPAPGDTLEKNKLVVPKPGDDTSTTPTNNDSEAEVRIDQTVTPSPSTPAPAAPTSNRPAPPSAMSPLARTGMEIGGLLAAAATLIGLGYVLLGARRRRACGGRS
jgi:uncharacterized repeat protein (TIGR01451 family)